MPGPRAKGKSGSKPKARSPPQVVPSSTLPRTEAYVDHVDNAEGWNLVVDILCEHFRLPGEQKRVFVCFSSHTAPPDLTRRSGLKRIHAKFPEIFKKLDNAYTANIGNEKIMGGIVGIWAKMSADALLRDKLFKAGGCRPESLLN